MTKTWEEVNAEMDAYRQTKQFKIDQFIYKCRRFITSPLGWQYHIKHWYQRANRGYSDSDVWNGDSYLASNIAGILTWIVEKGHGVSMQYADDWDTPVDIMVLRRDKEYKEMIAIFSEYAKNGSAVDEDWQKEFGGVLDKDMQNALQWLSKHFSELWD